MLFLDSVDVDAIRAWHSSGVVDGVTTNPTIVRKGGVTDLDAQFALLAKIIDPLPLAVEATTSGADPLTECRRLRSIAPNIVIKVPVINSDGSANLSLIHELRDGGIAVNATACFTVGQAYLAAKAGADYVTVFWSRILEEGSDAAEVVSSARRLLDAGQFGTKILVGSLRRTDDIARALLAGGHIVTAPPNLLQRWLDHYYARETVAQFERDERERAVPVAQ